MLGGLLTNAAAKAPAGPAAGAGATAGMGRNTNAADTARNNSNRGGETPPRRFRGGRAFSTRQRKGTWARFARCWRQRRRLGGGEEAETGADAEAADVRGPEGFTAMHFACRAGHLAVVNLCSRAPPTRSSRRRRAGRRCIWRATWASRSCRCILVLRFDCCCC